MFRLTPYNNRSIVGRDERERNDFYSMIDSFFDDSLWSMRNLQRDTFKVDVKEDDDAYLIIADLPGVDKEEISLQYDKDILSISIERKEEENSDSENFIHRERRQASMTRRMQLKGVDDNLIEAKLDNGVLTIKAPRTKEEKIQKTIEIQ